MSNSLIISDALFCMLAVVCSYKLTCHSRPDFPSIRQGMGWMDWLASSGDQWPGRRGGSGSQQRGAQATGRV